MKKLIPQQIKNWYHLMKAVLANIYFGFPSHRITVIGITGTNGKTTTTQMTTSILETAGYTVAMSSTINFQIGSRKWVNDTKYTTLAAWNVQRFLSEAVAAGCQYAVIETASHALDQYRVWGVAYDVAVITNVTREHLDYHKTMDHYRKTKMRLFKMLQGKRKTNVPKVAIINGEMERPEEFMRFPADKRFVYTTGTVSDDNPHAAEWMQAEAIQLSLESTRFAVKGQPFQLQIIGHFNVENALAAICIGASQGIGLDVAADALCNIHTIPGRMDYVSNDRGVNIIIDYALTPDSMEQLGVLIEPLKGQGRLIWVFGSCGDRDRGKRPIMGSIVARSADYVVVTNEDPYTEDPQQIIDEVFSGVISEGTGPAHHKTENMNAWRIMDRKKAIQKALDLARPGDSILVTGKGAEEVMAWGQKRIPWNDRKVIEEVLKEPAGEEYPWG